MMEEDPVADFDLHFDLDAYIGQDVSPAELDQSEWNEYLMVSNSTVANSILTQNLIVPRHYRHHVK